MTRKSLKYSVSAAVLATMIQVTPAFASPVTQGQIKATQGQIDDFETKIQKLDDRIISAVVKSQELDNQIKKQQGKIKGTKAEIEEAKKALDTHKKIYSERLKSLQSEGKQSIATYAELLLSSDNFSEFLTRFTAVSQILQSDTDLLDGLNKKEQALHNAEEKLHSELNNLKKSQDELAAEQKRIKEDKQEIAKELAAAKNKLQNQQDKLAQQEAEKEAKRQAELAAERAQQELQRIQQQGNQQSEQQSGHHVQRQVQHQSSGNKTAKKIRSIVSNNNTNSASASQVIATAKQYLGVPYVWGGTDPSGFDCSGFVGYVYRSVGISLPRVSSAQQNAGTRISVSQVQPGDLVFQGSPAHHVGIYIGGGQYIHAPQTGDVVKIAPFNPSKFSSAARVLH